MSDFPSVEAMPVVSIDTRKHLLPNSVKTRLGVGEAIIDHAAGIPLRSRRSPIPPLAPRTALYAPPTSSNVLDTHSNLSAPKLLRERFLAYDEPVELPLRSSGAGYVLLATLIAAFVGVLVSVVLKG